MTHSEDGAGRAHAPGAGDDALLRLLEAVAAGETPPAAALAGARAAVRGEIGVACLDHDRAARCGFPEVVYGEGKSAGEIVSIAGALRDRHGVCLVTRLEADAIRALAAAFPDAERHDRAGAVLLGTPPAPPERGGTVLVVSAGTSDAPVAEEALVTCRALGCRAEALRDVGVAGLHRLLAATGRLRAATVLIVVAGMEGALPSVVGGLVAAPVIAVPTRVGYGANFGGLAALLGMLNTCASGVGVVNIDNGFGAACLAARILRAAKPADPAGAK